MNTDTGFEYSMSGFLDYTASMETGSSGIWQLVGYIILLGTVISLIPQIHSLIKRRSSYGLNPLTLYITNFSQYILLFNIICLRTSDFVAIQQVNFFQILPRLMTFLNAFALWVAYLPIIFLNMVYFDKEPRSVRQQDAIPIEQLFNRLFTILNVVGSVIIMFIYFALLIFTGIGSSPITVMGKFFGTATLVSVVIQYIPQFITTCKLKDNGSFSLLLLAIQAPGGTASALFMAIGQGDHWTTWISTLAASIQQFCLLFLCLFFKWRRRRNKRFRQPLLGDESSATPNVVDPLMHDQNILS
ncbi:PQ loop repeat family protein [Tritrichomonas foetus]|uniref:PQ loop repeat family protein n=1 Tax=Tritrichomonas foetus TaxID=1144522 RepID=A0A1J4JWM4_9EUKA|nr:PQ loop repeat family protein [Tritrichomonas foetus]|eukprot:OHT03553.1 PQ loop repeat family protein [Tritrichomonas foetus]